MNESQDAELTTRQLTLLESPHYLAIAVSIYPKKLARKLLNYIALLTIPALVAIIANSTPDFIGRDLWIRLFAFNSENNIPSLFSGILLLVCAAILHVYSNWLEIGLS